MFRERKLKTLICLLLSVIQLSSGITSENITRIRRATDCFTCKTGECIDYSHECDGAIDCKDGSDETTACERLRCPSYSFRCNYGGCISSNLECDGKKDCKDGSDETSRRCKKYTAQCRTNQFKCTSGQCINQEHKCDGVAHCTDASDEHQETCGNSTEVAAPPPNHCVLPPHPSHGRWVLGLGVTDVQPGIAVGPGTILTFSCQNRYKLKGTEYLLCGQNSTWSAIPPVCAALCQELVSSDTITFRCTRNGYVTDCRESEDGTIATYQCKSLFENAEKVPSRKCADGSWNRPVPVCDPICGQKTVKAKPLIVNGTNALRTEYPWQMALYRLKNGIKEFQCGGSLISLKYAISAAHCVSDYSGNLHSTELFEVGVGKYFRNYLDPRDNEAAQYSEIKHIFVPSEFRGDDGNWQADIVVIETKKIFIPSNRVLPICVDYSGNYEDKILAQPNVKGFVSGWGLTEQNGQPSEVLKEIEAPYIPYAQCKHDLPPDFGIYLSHDKICAGYLKRGTAVCNGDSGGGLVFRNDADGKYYLTGVVSISPTTQGACNSNQYGLYTKVSKYIGFIYEKTL